MTLTEIRRISVDSPEYQTALRFRDRVMRRPLGLSLFDEDLDREREDIHLAAFLDGKIVGSIILTRIDDSTVRMRQVAVEELLRGRGIGRDMMHLAEEIARDLGYRRVLLDARLTAVGFYLKLGYAAHGEEFTEVGLPHVEMRKELQEHSLC